MEQALEAFSMAQKLNRSVFFPVYRPRMLRRNTLKFPF
jgi:hypothetical protein